MVPCWYFRILKMKMLWLTMAIHLSTTSSKSSGSSQYSIIGIMSSPLLSRYKMWFVAVSPHSDPATLSYCSSQWSFSTLSSVTQLSAHCCGYVHTKQTHAPEKKTSCWKPIYFCRWVSHPLVKKNRRVVLASFLLLVTGVGESWTVVHSSCHSKVYHLYVFCRNLDSNKEIKQLVAQSSSM